MSPASKHRDIGQLFDILASSGAYAELLGYWKQCMDDEYNRLKELAIAALKQRELESTAQIQYGRWSMAKEFYEFAEKHKK